MPPVRVQETSPLPLPLASNVLNNEFSFSDILISYSFVISRTERPDYLTINVSLPPRCCLRLPSRQRKSPWVSVCRMRPVNSRLSADRAYSSEHLRVRVSFVRFCQPVRYRCKRHFELLLFRVFLSVLLGLGFLYPPHYIRHVQGMRLPLNLSLQRILQDLGQNPSPSLRPLEYSLTGFHAQRVFRVRSRL